METLSKMIKYAESSIDIIFDDTFTPEKPLDRHDGAILGLYVDLINRAKTVNQLIEIQNYHTLDSISRVLFEGETYLRFILQKDTKKRGTAYAIKNNLDEYKLFSDLVSENVNARKIREYLKTDKETLLEKGKTIPEDYYSKLLTEFESFYPKGNKKRVWYNFDGNTTNFEQLCSKMNLKVEYETVYRILSKDVHSLRSYKNIKINNGIIFLDGKGNEYLLHLNIAKLCLQRSIISFLTYYNKKKDLEIFKINMRNHLLK